MTRTEAIEALAAALLERNRRNPAVTIRDEQGALIYFRAEATRRIDTSTDPAMWGGLVGYERHAAAVAAPGQGDAS